MLLVYTEMPDTHGYCTARFNERSQHTPFFNHKIQMESGLSEKNGCLSGFEPDLEVPQTSVLTITL